MAEEPKKLHYLIVGGAVTGSALAAALRDVASKVDVLEQCDSPDTMDSEQGGTGMVLCANVNAILQTDLLKNGGVKADDFRSYIIHGEENRQTVETFEDGKPIISVRLADPTWAVHRKTMVQKLYELASENENVHYHWRKTVKADGVDTVHGRVTTTDGEVFDADVIIGCDGVQSAVRRAILHANDLPVVTSSPLGVTLARFSLKKEDIPDSFSDRYPRPVTFDCDQARVVTYLMRDDGLLNVVFYFLENAEQQEFGQADEPWCQGKGAGLQKHIEALKPMAALRDVLQAPTTVEHWRLRSFPPLPTWSHGKAVVLGDAAHPMAPFQGSGAAMGLEDVEAFVKLIGAARLHDEAISTVFAELYKVRFLRASIVQSVSDYTPFPQDQLRQHRQRRAAAEAAKAKVVPPDERFVEARMLVDEKMKEYGLDAHAPALVRFAFQYPGFDEFVRSTPKLILPTSPHRLFCTVGDQSTTSVQMRQDPY